ncbi:MAG: hypothetical protein ACRCW2_14225 [Cellulosilyticaceae bacterium]
MGKRKIVAIAFGVIGITYLIYSWVKGEFSTLGMAGLDLLLAGMYGIQSYDYYKIQDKKNFWFYIVMSGIWVILGLANLSSYFA